MAFKYKSWFHRFKVNHEIEFPKGYQMQSNWPSDITSNISGSDNQIHKTLGTTTSLTVYAGMTLSSSSYWTTASHFLNLDHTSAPTGTFCKLSTSTGTATPSSGSFMASEYYIASNYHLNFVFMTEFIPGGQGWLIPCPLSFRTANQK